MTSPRLGIPLAIAALVLAALPARAADDPKITQSSTSFVAKLGGGSQGNLGIPPAGSEYWFFKLSGGMNEMLFQGTTIWTNCRVNGSLLHRKGPHDGEESPGPAFLYDLKMQADGAYADSSKYDPASGLTVRTEQQTLVPVEGAPNHKTHYDKFTATLVIHCKQLQALPQVWTIVKWEAVITGAHSKSAEDDGVKIGKAAVGSDGVVPRISVWGPQSYVVPIGTNYFALLIEDVTLPLSTTQPILMLGLDTETAFGGTLSLPLDLTPFGAPGFELLVDPLFFLPGQPPLGNHHAEVALSIPEDPKLIGLHAWAQWMLKDAAANAMGRTFTEAALFVIVK